VNALLLETAQDMDETAQPLGQEASEQSVHRKTMWKLAQLTREGAEFVISIPPDGMGEPEVFGTRATSPARWARSAANIARRLGERLEAGPVLQVAGKNMDRQVLVMNHEEKVYLVSWPAEAEGNLAEKTRKLIASWDS
jgi:hypothetical protein